MTKFFFLTGSNSRKIASAFAPDECELAHRLIPQLEGINTLPFKLELIKLSVGVNGLVKSNDLTDLTQIWLDYQPNSFAWPLMSEKMKMVIVQNLTGKENIDWISATIKGNNEQKIYYIPRFNKMLDVLDVEKTMFVPNTNHIIRPCFSLQKTLDYAVFHHPSPIDTWKITSLYVNEAIKKAILKEKLKGVVFESVLVI